MTQQKLAAKLGITFQQVQKYERGVNRISSSRLQQIARILSVPVNVFFKEPEASTDGAADAVANFAQFIAGPEGTSLNRAFARIKNARLRRSIIAFAEAVAGDAETITLRSQRRPRR
jgi:transcriptional regulator with XRE-family HTH domain